jgi:hypothetical protein
MHVQHAGHGKHNVGGCDNGARALPPRAGMMWELEGRAGALAGTFKVQNVANTLWEACVFSILRAPAERSLWMRVPSD